jgi:hypothetical protein
MTKKELSQLYWLNREIKLKQKELDKLEQSLNNMVIQDSVQGSGLSIPFAKHNISVAGIKNTKEYFRLKAEIEDVKALKELRQKQCIYEYNRLNRYIESIDDSEMRIILSLRYLNGLGWQQIANEIGGGNTDESIKKACYRFLNKKQSCPICPD